MVNFSKADLHVHSKYSDHPSTWGHKVYNSPESFTEVECLYQQAKQRGMSYVAITDHDDIRGCIELQRLHPDDTFISCKLTTFFPEDHCKIHVLVYGISETQFDQLKQLAPNIYDLRDYIAQANIAYSVAHASYDQDGKLSIEHIEKLVLLFDVFEILNGACDAQSNLLLHRYLEALDEDKNLSLLRQINELYETNSPGRYNLVIAGDGPDSASLKEQLSDQANVLFTGRLQTDELVQWYRNSDMLVFTSHTDTFGMVVLEAQAYGLPCLVTNTGGPKEIIQAGLTGEVLLNDKPEAWLDAIGGYRQIKLYQPTAWARLKQLCRQHVQQQNDWQPVFDAVLGEACRIKDIESLNTIGKPRASGPVRGPIAA